MEENILVKITGESELSEAQMGIRDLTAKGKDLQSQMAALLKAEQDDIAAVKARIAAGKEHESELQATIAYNKELQKALQQEINANERNIASLKKSVSAYNQVNGAGTKMAQQVKAIREQLMQMEMAGDTSSQTFVEMSVQAAKLTDQMGDTQRQIQILASDTKNLDAAMSIGSGVAGAFNVATSAAALLGGESEELQQAFLKVQAAMAVLNGVQQVANTLNKDSVANVVLRTAMQKIFNKEKSKEVATTISGNAATAASAAAGTADAAAKGTQAVATGAATKAQWSFNAAMLANPVMWLVAGIAALIAGVVALVSHFKKSAVEARNFSGALNDVKGTIKDSEDATGYAARLAEAEGKSWQQVNAIEKAGLQSQLDTAQKAYNKMVAQKKAAKGKLTDEEQKAMDELAQIVKDKQGELVKLEQDYNVQLATENKRRHDESIARAKEYAKQRREAIAEAEKQLQDVRIALMEAGSDKEIARIKLDYDRKIKAITGNSKAERQLRAELEKQRAQEIETVQKQVSDDEFKLQQEIAQQRLQNDVAIAESFGGQYLYDVKKETLEAQAQLEIDAITRSEENETLRAERILAVNTKLRADLLELQRSQAATEIEDATRVAEMRVSESENAAMRILNDENSTNEEIRAARETLANHDANLRQIRFEQIESQYARGLISEQEFQNAKLDIEREALEQESEMYATRMAEQNELAMTILDGITQMADMVFGAISDKIQQEMDDLDEYYTTDAEEAKENNNKKYLSEKEMEDKKLQLKRKAAAVEKVQSAFSIAMNTAMAIMRIWADVPKADFGATTIAMTAVAAALGAAQLAMVLSKPLPAYAKGRRGGRGEYALVGERGAELMYVPDGASIVPHDKLSDPSSWGRYGLPTEQFKAMPNIDRDIMERAIVAQIMGSGVDYTKLGKTIAENVNIPSQKAVHVNIDRSGIVVTDGIDTHRYLNTKYNASWN